MTTVQHYISNELTHLIGKDYRTTHSDELYNRLAKILKERLLAHLPEDELSRKNNGRCLKINATVKFSENEMFVPEMVCFCDIPIEELHIHTQKYGPFGLSFSKDFIAKNGGSPVYYLPKNAYIASSIKERLAPFFDRVGLKFYEFVNDKCSQPIIENEKDITFDYQNLLGFHILGYIKFFDHNLLEDAPDNFYFEREWRVLGNVEFKLKDVERVLMPKNYAEKFRKEFPEYCGQLSFTTYPEEMKMNNPQDRLGGLNK